MKKVMALVLSVALMFSALPVGFAADVETAGQKLLKLGLVSGYGNGQLGENDSLTRAQMMVIMAQLKGVDAQAKSYALPSKSIDVDPYAWYAPYVAYAESQNWTSGIGNNRFGPNQILTAQESAAFMVKALGYTITDYKNVMNQADALKITSGVFGIGSKTITRGEVFTYMYNTINTPMANSTITLGVSLGVIQPEKPTVPKVNYVVSTVEPLAYKLVEVKLAEATTGADASQFKIVDPQGATLNIEKADLMDSKTIWLTTAEQKAGGMYTLMADKSIKFAGMSKDLSQPMVNKAASKGIDNVTYKLVFDKDLDPRSALVTSNYSVDNGMTILGVKFDKDSNGKELRNEVLLSTSSQKLGQLYRMTVQKMVTDLAGNSVKNSEDLNVVLFGGLQADTTAPKVSAAIGINALKATIYFDDESGLDQTTAENIGNYKIINKTNPDRPLNVISAKLIKDANGKYVHVEVRTTQMDTGSIYEVSASNVSDKFGNIISPTSNYRTTFSGQPLDNVGPRLLTAEPMTNTKFKLNFNETLNKTSAESYGNFTVSNGLAVLKSEVDATDDKVVYITTSTQTSGIAYVITVSNVMDEYGNLISSSYNKAYVSGVSVDSTLPRVISAQASVESGGAFVTVKFSESVGETSAKLGSNYYFGSELGYGFGVVKVSADTYKVRTNAQTESKIYTMTVSNVEDQSGNVMDSGYNTASFVGKAAADTDPVKVNGVASVDRQTMTVIFNKPMQAVKVQESVSSNGAVTDRDASDPDNYKIYLSGSSSALGVSSKAYVSKDKTMVTLRYSTPILEAGKVYTIKVNANAATDDFDDAVTALYDTTGLSVQVSNASSQFGGIGVDLTKPRLVTAYALNEEVVYLKFNAPVMKEAGFAGTDIQFSASNHTTRFAVAAYTNPLASDPTILAVKTDGKLDPGATYTVTISVPTNIKDIYKDQSVDTSSNGAVATFYSNSNGNDSPVMNRITANDSSSITVLFSEEIDALDATDYRLTTNGAEINPSHVEFTNSSKNEVRLYFDNTNMTAGSAYKLIISANRIADTFGKLNATEMTEYFATIGGTRALVNMSNAYALDNNTIRIVFTRPVGDVVNALDPSDFAIANQPAGVTWSVDKAYGLGALVELSGGVVPTKTYVDIIDLKANKLLSKDVTYTVTFNAGTAAQYKAKDGAGLDGTPSKSFVGTLNMDNYKLTSGVASADSVTATSLDVTITDNSLSSTTVKNTYAKVGYIAALAAGNPYDSQTALVAGVNAFNMASAVAKGTTPMTLNVGANGTYDVVVIFYDSNNVIIGYSLIENVVVS